VRWKTPLIAKGGRPGGPVQVPGTAGGFRDLSSQRHSHPGGNSMSARHRRSTAAAVAAGAAALLTLCGTAATAMAAPSAKASAVMVAAAASAHTVTVPRGLTISDGTRHVVVNGKSIDFGTIVRDLAWNPSGSKA